jgi:magnesium-transporting ATPase (P-type)
VWVLTGDKIGTAINIGMSAGLPDNSEKMDQYIIRESNHIDKLIEELSTILFEIKKNDMKHDTAEVISNNPNKKKRRL